MTPAQQQEEAIKANKALFDEVEFSMEVKSFLGSPVGQYLLARAEAERESGVEALLEADPSNMVEILRLQSQVKRADSFQQWMTDAIQVGNAARVELESQDRANFDEE